MRYVKEDRTLLVNWRFTDNNDYFYVKNKCILTYSSIPCEI